MTKRTAWFVVAAVAAIAIAGLALVEKDPERRATRHAEPNAPARAAVALDDSSERGPAADATPHPALLPAHSARPIEVATPDEALLMARLRSVMTTDPNASVALAREGNRRFPGSDDAPERGFILVKSLVSLGRFEEARAEAVVMVDTYRDTSWANDVERHLLTNPLTHPSERGFGKARE